MKASWFNEWWLYVAVEELRALSLQASQQYTPEHNCMHSGTQNFLAFSRLCIKNP